MDKTCSRCDFIKPLDAFSRRASALDGKQAWCRSCMAEACRERRLADPGRVKTYNAKYRQERPEVAEAATRRWREANPERVALQKRKWAARNREAIRASRERNAESRAAKLAAWKAANRERVREYQRKRRAAGYGGALGEVDGEALWVASGGLCAICDNPIDLGVKWPALGARSLDHVVALSKGGLHETENCAWTHLGCNLAKGAR